MVGALLLKITAKKALMNRKCPFPVHRRVTSGYVYFKRKSFVCVADRKDFNPVGHCLLCAFTAECFTQAFYKKGTR